MIKIIFSFLLLAVASNNVMAEWVAVGTAVGSTYYVNPNTIRKSGNKVKMWTLIDYNSTQIGATGDKFLSLKFQEENDCKEEQRRLLYYSFHSENMGRGDVVYIEQKPDKNWKPVPPESMGESLWKFACGK